MQPFDLTEQQREFILSSYAAFAKTVDIVETFGEYFPDAVEAFKDEDPVEWRIRLEVSIKLLNPEHPDFPEQLAAPFTAMRQKHLRSLDDIEVSHAKERIRRYHERLQQLDTHRDEGNGFEMFRDCVVLENQIMDRIFKEVYRFHEFMADEGGLSEEETKALLEKLSPDQLAEVKKRLSRGELLEIVLLDVRYMVRTNMVKDTDETPQDT